MKGFSEPKLHCIDFFPLLNLIAAKYHTATVYADRHLEITKNGMDLQQFF